MSDRLESIVLIEGDCHYVRSEAGGSGNHRVGAGNLHSGLSEVSS